jgi:hypothetical protein
MIGPNMPRRYLVTGILGFVLTLVLFCNPPTAYADLADEIEAAFQTAIQGMVGTEFTNDSVTFDFEGVEVTFTVIGFALCEPSDPYAPPILNPIPPLNVYECQNVTTVGADVASDETSASVLIEFSHIFLDLESSRDKTLFCLEFPPGTVAEDGYMLGHASVEVGIQLEFVDGCFRSSLVPGSSSLTLVPDEIGSKDACLTLYMDDIVVDVFYPLVQDYLDTVFEATLVLLMDDINNLLCDATPNDYNSWGSVKSIFR